MKIINLSEENNKEIIHVMIGDKLHARLEFVCETKSKNTEFSYESLEIDIIADLSETSIYANGECLETKYQHECTENINSFR